MYVELDKFTSKYKPFSEEEIVHWNEILNHDI